MLRRAALPTFDAGVRRAGAIAIMNLAERLNGKLDDPNVVPELVALLRDDNEELRGLAALTLGFVGSEGARRGLTAAVNDPSPRVRFDAANALARLGDPAALPVLAEMLDFEGLKQRFALPDDRAGQPYDRELVNASLLTAMHSVAKLHAAKQPISMPVQNALAKLAESTDSAIRSEALNVQRKIAQ